MKILIVSQHFWPESFRINEVAKSLHAAGCDVTVLTGQPNYPDGRIFEGYSSAGIRRQKSDEGYTICRVPLVPRGRGSAVRLILNYLSFMLSATLFGPVLLRRQSFDVIFVYGTSPILQAIPAIALKRLKRSRLVIWVQDLWPQSLAITGFVTNKFLLKIVERLVVWIYERADLLMVQSRAFANLVGLLSRRTPVEYFPNPSEAVLDGDRGPKPRLLLEPGFNVVFAGNIGTVQALDTVLHAAEQLRSEDDIRFVLIGSGSRFEWLRQTVSERGLRNVFLPGRYSSADMPDILSQASVLLVSLARSPVMSQTIPSKIQTYLAVGRPILAALDGEGAQIVLEAGAGLAVPAEDAGALAEAVLRIRALEPDERLRMGAAARRYHAQHFDSQVLTRRLIDHFQALLDDTRRSDNDHHGHKS